jgi:predicted RNA binding protein YcfA (HicA-like mRNA interferase family)
VPGLKPVSGETVIKILSKQYGFAVTGQSGSHVRLSKIDPDDFARYL